MRLSVVKHEKYETIHYNPGIFQEREELITFPFQEFDKFYDKTFNALNVVSRMIDDSLNPESNSDPKTDLDHILDWINLMQEDLDLLIKFDLQTDLDSFKGFNNKILPIKRVNEITIDKEELQCLMGL